MPEWGTNRAGIAWHHTPDASAFSVGPGSGRITLAAPNVHYVAYQDVAVVDVDVSVMASVDQTVTGDRITAHIVARRHSASNFVAAAFEFKPNGRIGLALYDTVPGNSGWLGGHEYPEGYTPGLRYYGRFQLVGPTVRCKAWASTDPEPDHWPLLFQVSNTSPGAVGLAAIAAPANTNSTPTVSFYDYRVPNPQAFRVKRSLNGVVKPHEPGTSVSLAHPLRLAL